MKHDIVADTMSAISNAEKAGKEKCKIPMSKIVERIVKVMKDNGFIKNYEIDADSINIKLCGRINVAKVIKPRFAVKGKDMEKWETRYLPAKGVGLLILTTPKGIMSHEDVKKNKLGGRLLCYIF
jgi:small subunit ribosomal protein S8